MNDKFFDILRDNTKPIFDKKGNFLRLNGIKELSEKMKVPYPVVKRWRNYGVRETDKKYFPQVNKKHRGYDKVKQVSKEFNPHTFTFENWYKTKKSLRIGRRSQFFFRAGLYIETDKGYIIPNLPVSHYYRVPFKQAYRLFFDIIKKTVSEKKSIKFFRINYFFMTVLKT